MRRVGTLDLEAEESFTEEADGGAVAAVTFLNVAAERPAHGGGDDGVRGRGLDGGEEGKDGQEGEEALAVHGGCSL
jgi:hypothetical protein